MTQDYFSIDYQQARARFLNAARDCDLTVDAIPHPSSGPDGLPIATDIIHIGAEPGQAKARLILSSGTHGIEGYAGSAIQTFLLHQGLFSALPDHVGVTIIHAINPFGFAHDRRVNEDNVDLNRNFIDHAKGSHLVNEAYRELNAALNPQSLDAAVLAEGQESLRAFVAQHGAKALQSAVSQGQYEFPKGIFYGGTKPVWSNLMIRRVLNGIADGLEQCVILDVHTGLGAFGVGEIIMEDPSDSVPFQHAARIWAQGVTSTRPKAQGKQSSSAALSGTIDVAFWQELAPALTISTTLEFGTVPSSQVSTALRDDNWLYNWGQPTEPEARPIKQAMRDAFYPQDAAWKQQVLQQGDTAVREALSWLADPV